MSYLTHFILEWGVAAHRFFECLAYFLGFQYYLYLRKRRFDPICDRNRIWIIGSALIGSVIISKIPILWEPNEILGSQVLTGKTIVGALVGGSIFVELIKKLIREPKSSGDLFCFPLIIGMIVGRIGCFLGGVHDQTFGVQTSFLGFDFGDSIMRHPTQLYEILFLLIMFFFLKKFQKKLMNKNGALFQTFLLSYFVFRLCVDTLKPLYIIHWLGLSSTQILSLVGCSYSVFMLSKINIKKDIQFNKN